MAIIPKNLKELKLHLQDPLFKNSYFILFTSGSINFFGFLFWIIAARYYTANDVGLATAIFSISQLICVFSSLGLSYSLIRYYNQLDNRNEMINSCLSLVALSTMIITLVFLLGIKYWAPALIIIRDNYLLLISFVSLTIFYSIFNLQSNIFIAVRSAKLSFFQNLIYNILRLPLPIVFISFGILGIISSWTIATFIAFLFGGVFLIPKVLPGYKRIPKINKKIIKEIMPFSFGNYISGIFNSFPIMILPLMIVNILDVENAAYYYVAWSIAVVFSTISSAVTTSLFAEGSINVEEQFHLNVLKSIKYIFFLLIPTTIFIFLVGNKLLLFFGQPYSGHATMLLWLFSIGNIPFAINQIYLTIKRIQVDIKPIIYVNAFTMIFMIVGSYFFLTTIGLVGIGISWIISQGLVALITGFLLKRSRKKDIVNNNEISAI